MKEKALAIFIYDLCALGREDIVINNELLGLLHQYILEDFDSRFAPSLHMFDVTEEEDGYIFHLSLDRINSACELVRSVSSKKQGFSAMFDGFDFETTQEIGDFAVGFSTYLDMIEDIMYEIENSPYKLIKS